MKTIKLIVKVTGYLNDIDRKDLNIEESSMNVEADDNVEELTIEFLRDNFFSVAREALRKWHSTKYDYQGVKSEN